MVLINLFIGVLFLSASMTNHTSDRTIVYCIPASYVPTAGEVLLVLTIPGELVLYPHRSVGSLVGPLRLLPGLASDPAEGHDPGGGVLPASQLGPRQGVDRPPKR